MTSRRKTSLSFVTWNIRGLKNPHKKLQNMLNILRRFESDIVFIQETHIGMKDKILKNIVEDESGMKWKVYFTVHSSRSKGVAILIRNNLQFEYICHDEDCSGGYVVLFCRLNGELFTLVNVYKHHKDKLVLDRLKEYLQETAEGVLVVGGDFNTVLDKSSGRNSSKDLALRKTLENFIASLKLKDTWSSLHPTAAGFTLKFTKTKGSGSRIDMFFLPEDKMGLVPIIEVKEEHISDHYPLVLELSFQEQAEQKPPTVVTKLNKSEYCLDKIPGEISGAEILSAIKSLPEEHTPDTNNTTLHSLTETLKIKYNHILRSQQVPENFKHSEDRNTFTDDYLVFSEVLAKRINILISLEKKCDVCVIVIFERSPQKIRWSFLETIFKEIKEVRFAPPPDFHILDHLLPETKSSTENLRDLHPDCPLTSAILNLALEKLVKNVKLKLEECKTTVCYHKHSLIVHAQQSKQEQVACVVEKFQIESGVRLSFN